MNIELGSGCKSFGKAFLPKCIAIDNDNSLYLRCPEYDIDEICDATSLPYEDNSFNFVIICNPYDYGFSDLENGLPLLSEIHRVIKNDGSLIIIGSYTNKWCTPVRVEKILEIAKEDLGLIFSSEGPEKIVSELEYPGYQFHTSDGSIIYPQFRLRINVSK